MDAFQEELSMNNDYTVKTFGIETVEVSDWQDTTKKLEVMLADS